MRGGETSAVGPDVQNDVLGTMARNLWFIVVCVVLGALVALPFVMSRTPVYTASTRVLVQRATADSVTGGSLSVDPARVLQTEALVVTGREVRQRVRARLGRAPSVTVMPLAQSDVLSITATSSDPVDATEVANAFTAAYVAFREDNAKAPLTDSRRVVSGELARVDRRLQEASDPDRQETLRAEQDELQQRLGELDDQLASATAGVAILNQSSPPERADRFTALRDTVLAGVLAGAVGLAGAWLRERLWGVRRRRRS